MRTSLNLHHDGLLSIEISYRVKCCKFRIKALSTPLSLLFPLNIAAKSNLLFSHFPLENQRFSHSNRMKESKLSYHSNTMSTVLHPMNIAHYSRLDQGRMAP